VTESRPECEGFADDLVALALGTITGRARADVIAHVDACPHCTGELEALSGTTDRLLRLVPAREPPFGFEVRVLTRIREARRARLSAWRRQTAALVAAAALVAGVVGFLVGHDFGSARPAKSASTVFAVFHTASRPVGELSVTQGRNPRLEVQISGLGTNGPVTCRVVGPHARATTVGVFWLYHGSGSWTAPLPFPASELRGATLTSPNGSVLARASRG